MSQVSKYPIRKEVADRIFEIFTKVLLNTTKRQEAEELIKDLFTPTERVMLSKRLAIAFLLEKGYTYQVIKSILRVSSPTIATVNLARLYGSSGYIKLLSKIMREESVQAFLQDITIKLVSLPANTSKGAGTWRYLAEELKKRKKSNRKSF